MVSLALRSSCSEFGRPRSVKTLPLLFSCVATISPLSFYLVQSFGRFQALANDLDIALGCRDTTLRIFPKRRAGHRSRSRTEPYKPPGSCRRDDPRSSTLAPPKP